ncbi:MAG: DUF6882 domain-containing protein [Candidatus Berkiella sp.]
MSDDLTLLLGRIGFAVSVAGYLGYWLWNKMKNRNTVATNDTEDDLEVDSIVNESMIAQLIENAVQYATDVQEETLETYFDSNADKYDRYHINMEEGTLTFYTDNVPMVQAQIQVVGSHSKNSNTWMWSTLNGSIPAICTNKMDKVKDFLGVVEWGNFDDVTEVEEGFIGDAVYLSLMVLEGVGFYKAPSANSDLYVVMTDIDWVQKSAHH